MSVMNDALKNICNAEKSGKRQVNPSPFVRNDQWPTSNFSWFWQSNKMNAPFRYSYIRLKKSGEALSCTDLCFWHASYNSRWFFICYRLSSDQSPRPSSSSSRSCSSTDTSLNSRSSMMLALERSSLTWTEDSTNVEWSHQTSISSSRTSRTSALPSSHPVSLESLSSPLTRASWTMKRLVESISVERSSATSTEPEQTSVR